MKLRPIESAPHHSSNAAALSPLCERTVHSIETISTLQYTAILQGIDDEPNLSAASPFGRLQFAL